MNDSFKNANPNFPRAAIAPATRTAEAETRNVWHAYANLAQNQPEGKKQT